MNPPQTHPESRRNVPRRERPTTHEAPLMRHYENTVDFSVPYMRTLVEGMLTTQDLTAQPVARTMGAHAVDRVAQPAFYPRPVPQSPEVTKYEQRQNGAHQVASASPKVVAHEQLNGTGQVPMSEEVAEHAQRQAVAEARKIIAEMPEVPLDA